MQDLTVMKPPFDGDQNRGWGMGACNATFLGVVILLILARLYTKIVVVRGIGLDDYLIIVAGVRYLLDSTIIKSLSNTSVDTTDSHGEPWLLPSSSGLGPPHILPATDCRVSRKTR